MRAVALVSPLLLLALVGCTDGKTNPDTQETNVIDDTSPTGTDADGDGWAVEDGDCDDGNADIHPGQAEICNNIDDNCNGDKDEGLPDADNDGVCNGLDTEDCDGVDNNGDGKVDEGYGDADGDGVADCADGEQCDGVDNNGDGQIDEGYDADGDGYTQCGDATGANADCDDSDKNVHPGATESNSNQKDDDCDGYVDEGAWSEGDVFITEIMNNPSSVSDPKGEWFEIYNASGHTVLLNGVVIADSATDYHQITSITPITVNPGEYFVLGSNGDKTTNGGVDVGYVFSGVSLGNSADDLQLYVMNDAGKKVVIDSVSWDGGTSWPAPDGASMSLEPSFNAAEYNDDPQYWCASANAWGSQTDKGTPGVANDPCTSFDHDGDGYSVDQGDCNDTDATVYPGAPEIDPTVDNDCDGTAEQGPTAVATEGSGSSSTQCGTVYLDGSASSDPQGDTPLTYQWELTSAPATSTLTTADLSNATSASASFTPDVDGTYTFSLTVWDSGGAASVPTSLSIVVGARGSNGTPTADAGANQSASASATCTPLSYGSSGYECESCDDYVFNLDGTASSDPDGDKLSYAWSITAGAGSLDDSTSPTPKVTVSGPTPTYGSSDTETVFVSLKVTDCMGAVSAADTLALSYTCSGS